MSTSHNLPLFITALTLSFVTHSSAQEAQPAPAPDPALEEKESDEPGESEHNNDKKALEARLKKMEEALANQGRLIEKQQAELEKSQLQSAEAEAKAEEAQASSDEMMALQGGDEDSAASEEKLRLYGFADMALNKIYLGDGHPRRGFIPSNSTFAVGNVNLYIDAKPVPNFRVLSEIRFTLFPHGSLGDDFEPIDASVYDSTAATGRNRVIQSGIVMERAWIEWNKYDFFKVRSGYFLTPYGIWNVDHGTPTLISSVLPSFWASEYFPTRQVGLQVLGEAFVGDWELGYRAYIGNGRMTSQLDLDSFKLFGGRVYAAYYGDVNVQIGSSGFYNKQAEYTPFIESFDPFVVDRTINEEYEEFGVGADLGVDIAGLRVRGEFVLNQQEWSDGLRRETSSVTYQRDRTRWNTYGIAAYQLPYWGLEPYVYVEYNRSPRANSNSFNLYSGGLIEHLAPGVQLKLQAYYVKVNNDEQFPNASENENFPGWDLRFVTAF